MDEQMFTFTDAQKDKLREWVKALRSGTYTQGKELLRTSDGGYCCLGVLCELSALGQWEQDRYGDGFSFAKLADKTERREDILPAWVAREFGFVNADGTVECDPWELAQMNDEGSTFEELADVIEKRAGL
jgi:hypothetical protein